MEKGKKNALSRIRTYDLLITSEVPYQLGHKSVYSIFRFFSQYFVFVLHEKTLRVSPYSLRFLSTSGQS